MLTEAKQEKVKLRQAEKEEKEEKKKRRKESKRKRKWIANGKKMSEL